VLYANYLMRSMMAAGREALAHLAEHGETTSRTDRMATWSERQELFNLPAFTVAEAALDRPWSPAP
jgi:2-methylisocitrate lyase-like PEP mutase family enzyme